MIRKLRSVLLVILAVSLALSAAGCAKYEKYVLVPADDSVSGPTSEDDVKQLTVDDIQAMNGGNATIVYGDPDENGNRYVTFINGKYYDEKVEDAEQAVESLKAIALLIGFGKGSEFFANFGERDSNGYTYWVLQQRYGTSTVQNATIRVVVDPEGYVCGLSSSAVPNIGIAPDEEGVGSEAAIARVQDYMKGKYPGEDYKLYDDNILELVTEYFGDGNFYHVYAVYTSNPDLRSGATFDLPFLQHLVSFEGKYLFNNATSTMAQGETPEATNTEVYFENLEGDFWEGDVTLHDGSKMHITVPVAKSTVDDTYYLADVDRKILMADWNAFMTDFSLDFITSKKNSGWADYMLLQMYNYGRAYDFYKELGLSGPDTFGTPMLILTDWEEGGMPVENACCYGNIKGWMAFGASNDYYFEQSLDVLAHEFTHGVTGTEMLGSIYMNETGAINEAMSDIMGEICEQMAARDDGTPEVDDDMWYHGQGKPEPGRCMSDPNQFEQPGCVGDLYYITPSKNADTFNDFGGNHFNSSLLNYVAWKLFDKGMPLEEERDLWYTTICLMTPGSDYDDVYAALQMSVQINGLEQRWADLITKTWDEIGLSGDRLQNAYAFERENCGRLAIQIDLESEVSKVSRIRPFIYNDDGTYYSTLFWLVPDDSGWIYGLLPEGEYILEMLVTNLEGTEGSIYYYKSDGSWGHDAEHLGTAKITEGYIAELNPVN